MFFEIHHICKKRAKNTKALLAVYNREMENETFRLPVSRAATEPLDDPHFNPVRTFVLNDADLFINQIEYVNNMFPNGEEEGLADQCN